MFAVDCKNTPLQIQSIRLHNFRNHSYKALDITGKDNIIVLIGANGTGKTSVLEGISLFSPVKSILGAKPSEQVLNTNPSTGYTVQISLACGTEMSATSNGNTKNIKINGKTIKKNTGLLNWCDILWFTAMMHYELFSPQMRRKFFDRITFYLHHNHADLVNECEKLVKARMLALKGEGSSPWLDAIEHKLASIILLIAQNRQDTINRLNKEDNGSCQITMEDKTLEMTSTEEIREYLSSKRQKDLITERSSLSHSRVQFNLTSTLYNTEVETLSSGQQKMLFLDIIYNTASVIGKCRMRSPIILLDEIPSFLDNSNLKIAMDKLKSSTSQVWITTQVELPKFANCETICLNTKQF